MQSNIRLRSTLRGAIALALVLLAVSLLAQQNTISVDVKVVNVLATVRNKHGDIINELNREDFTLQEDGRSQVIKYFNRDTDMPLTLGLLVDTSASQREVLGEERTASAVFTNEVLRDGTDSAFVIHFDHEVELLQDVTSSRQKVSYSISALDETRDDRWQRGGGGGGYPSARRGSARRGGGPGAGTLLYDAIFLASDELMHKQQGRKAILVLTDGVDHGSKMSLESAIESAQRADTMVYSIYYPGQENGDWGARGGWGRHGGGWPGPLGGSDDGKRVLQRLSKETGGRMFEVSRRQPIDQIYAQIQAELRNQYSLGYSSDRPPGDTAEYRHIHVATKNKDFTVQAREGYYASRQIDADLR